MDMTYLFVFTVFTQLQRTHSLTASASGSTPRGKNFFHKKFPVPPAKYAMIEVDVLIPRDQVPKTTLFMGIYTTEDNADIKRRCTHNQYGQLGNKNLYTVLRSYLDLSGPLSCRYNWALDCTGEISIQDYTPRNFSFSFGFFCHQGFRLLPDLQCEMTIHVTNETTCDKVSAEHMCHRHMQFGVLPNLRRQTFNYFEPLPSCLQLFQISTKFLCYLLMYECDPESNQIIPPCMEMCYDYINLCDYHLGSWKHWKYINCSYLPSLNKEFHVFMNQ